MAKAGFIDKNSQEVIEGDRVFYSLRSVEGIVEDILQDGDATLKLDDGKLLLVKWNRLTRI